MMCVAGQVLTQQAPPLPPLATHGGVWVRAGPHIHVAFLAACSAALFLIRVSTKDGSGSLSGPDAREGLP